MSFRAKNKETNLQPFSIYNISKDSQIAFVHSLSILYYFNIFNKYKKLVSVIKTLNNYVYINIITKRN